MADHREPSPGSDSSSFQRTVTLRDWWLIKCSKDFQGKQFGVAGTEIAASVESRAMRVFTSSPIIKAFDVFTLQASDGICITLRGFLNKERVVKSGFTPQISRDFIFGFPPCWEQICNNCFRKELLPATDINTVPSVIEQASCPILSPCENTKVNLADSPAESRDKSPVTDKNTAAEINDKGGRSGGSIAKDKRPARLRAVMSRILLSGKSPEDERKLELNKVQNTTSDGDHGGEGLDKAKTGDVEKDDCETVDNEDNERMLDESKVENRTNDGDHGGERLDEAKVTRASPHSLSKDFHKSNKPGKKGISKKSGKTLKSDGNVVEPVNHSRSKLEEAGEITNRKIDFDFEATPDKVVKKQKNNVVSTDSLGQKRSRSGRVLVQPLEFWRNQVPNMIWIGILSK